MPATEFLSGGRWPIDGLPIATLNVRVEALAERLDTPLYVWHVEGLGEASGFGGRMEGVSLFLLEELEHEVKGGATGPTLYADAGDIAAKGVEPLLDEILAGLGLTRADVVAVANPTLREVAAERVAAVARGPRIPS